MHHPPQTATKGTSIYCIIGVIASTWYVRNSGEYFNLKCQFDIFILIDYTPTLYPGYLEVVNYLSNNKMEKFDF